MACETITVTNTLTNDVCDGDYEKTPDILEWVNVANPTCKIVKIFDVATNSWIWAFQIHTEPGSDPPPDSKNAVVTYAPTKVTIKTETFFTQSLDDGPGECGNQERKVGEAERIYVLDSGNSTRSSLNILTQTGAGGSSGSNTSYECRVTITNGGDSAWSVGDDVSYHTFKIKVNQLSGYGDEPPQGDVYAEATEGNYINHDTVLISPTGTENSNKTTNSRPYWGIKHTVFGQNLSDSDRLENYGCLNSMSGTYTGSLYNSDTTFRHEWQVVAENYAQYLFRDGSGHSFYTNILLDLAADPTGYPCWNQTWILETDTFANTTEDSVCPADADWSGTGLTIEETVEEEESQDPKPAQGPQNFVAEEECRETIPTEIDGFYPLYTSELCARQNGNGSFHTHEFNGDTWYMPEGVEVFHGNYGQQEQEEEEETEEETEEEEEEAVQPPLESPTYTSAQIVEPYSGVSGMQSELISDDTFIGSTIPEKYQGYVWNQRSNSLSGPFVSKGVTAVTTRDNSSEMFAVDRNQVVLKTVLTDLNDPSFPTFHDPFTRLKEPFVGERGVIISEVGNGYLYDHKFKPSAFEDAVYGQGTVEKPLFFRDSYLSIAETNWMYLGDEHSEKQIHRVDLRFHKNSCGHLSLFVQNEDGKIKGQYRGAIKEHMKVFTNLRGRGFKICMLVATHEDYPWAMREMAIGYLVGKSF